MRVNLAAQVLISRSVVAGIRTALKLSKFKKVTTTDALSTANFIEKIDKLFELF